MAGNRQGSKTNLLYYTDDVNVAYILQRDDDLILDGLGAAAAAPEVYDPQNIPAGVIVGPKPQGFKPRVVFIQAPDGARKNMIAFHPTSELYLKNFSDAFPAIDGENTWVSTGRKGESLSFV